ncbi:MAG: methylmalonyl Co-A mutase-associated GTPase MeaB [Flavobacterium sp. BFFFF2]|nr:MAG: methylmalonyl Co-A mutase-associated GTPase MeaB [Flavobacterium sp. BFFFF2]
MKPIKTALTEQAGVTPQPSINPRAVALWQQNKGARPTAAALIEGIKQHNRVALSRAITLVESTLPDWATEAEQLIQFCLMWARPCLRIGITGVPGVGKSTFIETFGTLLTQQGLKVAVLAIDPSSSLSRGSILGDKTRMETLVNDPLAFIRPSASGTTLGGVARKTREAMMLCEAFGFDVILVETVGVGQSETLVHQMVDFFLLLKLAGAGDELQGIKRGIMEMADAVIINKADGDNINKARLAKTEFQRALHYFPPKETGWIPKVQCCSAIEGAGVNEVWQLIQQFETEQKQNGHFEQRRRQQNQQWMRQTIQDQLFQSFMTHPAVQEQVSQLEQQVELGVISPFSAAQQLIERYRANK